MADSDSAVSHCGDWLLLAEGLEPATPRRSGPWRKIFRGGGYALFVGACKPGWVGAPWRMIEDGETRVWILGESVAGDGAILEAARGGDASTIGGRFLLLVFDGQEFEIVTDPFGTLHAYAVENGRAISTSFSAVSEFSARHLDWAGLTSFFACGFFLGERTFWDDIRSLGPARRHRFAGCLASPTDCSATSTRYREWRYQPERGRSLGETADAFGSIFEAILAEQTGGGRVALPLSGGLDSRALAAAAPAGSVAWSFGYGYQENSIEIRLARQIARRRQLPFDAFVVEPYLSAQIDRAMDLVEGFQNITQTRQLQVAGPLAERADYVLGGHWGDVWLDDMGLAAAGSEASNLIAHTLGKLRKRGRAWLLEHLCAPQVEAPDALLASQVRDHLEDYGHIGEVDFRLKAFKTDHWSARWTLASVRAYQAGAFPRLPFYDPRLADFFTTVPTDLLLDRRLELEYLRRSAPDLARIPWQETGAHLYRSRRAAHYLGLPRRALDRALRFARREKVIQRNWEAQLLGPGGRRLLEERLLSPGLRLHDLVAAKKVRSLLEEFHRQPTAEVGYSVSMLLTFAVFLERA